jgi:P4 family phage/plasmid primase-like protien
MGIFGEWAEAYSEHNLAVIPCNHKKAFLNSWTEFCRRKPNDDELNEWISKHKNCNIGLTLGEANELIAFDFDYAWPDDPKREPKNITKEEFEKERAEIEAKVLSMLPNSPCKKVGKPGKWTAFFRPNGIARNFTVERYGITVFEILYDGRQTILPPSIHPDTNKPYEWIGQDLISSLDILPELTLDKLEAYGETLRIDNVSSGASVVSGRNDLLKKAVFGMFHRGISPENCVQHLLEIDKEKCNPPMFSDKEDFPRLYKTPEKAAEKFAKSCHKSFKNNLFKENSTKVLEKCQFDEDGSPYEQIGFYYKYTIPQKSGDIKIKYSPQYKLMAEQCFSDKNLCYDDTMSLKFDGKKWSWMSKIALYNFIIMQNKDYYLPQHLDLFAKAIKGFCFIDALGVKQPDGLINVNNGVIDVKSGTLLPHSHEYLFKYCSPVDFDENADCPNWETFLMTIFKGNIELIDLAQRLFGYILIGGKPFLHRAFVLYGNGRNGKSTFLDVLRAVIGADAYSTVSMAKLDKEFSLVNIDGKLANIVEETPNDEINAEIFKTLVGGGEVQAAHKGFDEFTFRCNARFVFACNDMPIFKDKSRGLEERLVFIPFERYFEEHERDTKITEKLLCELPGIFNWALMGVRMILRDPQIPNYESLKISKELYKTETNSIYAWCKDHIVIEENAPSISISAVYDRYKKDVISDGGKPFHINNFSKELRKLLSSECRNKNICFDEEHRFYDAMNKRQRGFNIIKFI